MSEEVDMAIEPKSDQLNADDLIAGPRTIRITRVTAGSAEQKVNVYFEYDNGKPYRPCKSMRRVMVAAWGKSASQYVGRSMTLYRDPKVTWGGMEVGGIRISHMSHIDADFKMALTESKKKRGLYTVRRLVFEPSNPEQLEKALEKIRAAEDEQQLDEFVVGLRGLKWTQAEGSAVKTAIEKKRGEFGGEG